MSLARRAIGIVAACIGVGVENPIVPIALEYKTIRDYWINSSLATQYFRQFSKFFTHSKIEFGPVLNSDDGDELHDQAKNWIDSKLLEMQNEWSTAFSKE